MYFEKLYYIHLLWIVIALALFLFYRARKRRSMLEQFASREMLDKLLTRSESGRLIKIFLFLLGLTFLVLALMEPKWGYTWEEMKREGRDIIVAVDVSRSMLAQDIAPSRLERAKRAILDLMQIMQGDRIGLVAFAGSAFVQCPLTLDYGAAKMFLSELDPSLIPKGGTQIGEAIIKSVNAFEGNERNTRALILITDGENLQGDLDNAIKMAKEKGVKIFCIGIGTPSGSPIQITDEKGRKTYITDRSGNQVLSKLNEETLQKIALETGGAYAQAVASGLELDAIYTKRIANMDTKELDSSKKKHYEHRFQWPVCAAFFCFFLQSIVSEGQKKTAKEGEAA